MRRRLAATLLAPLAVLSVTAGPAAGAEPDPPTTGTTEHRITIGGTDRRYLLVVPPDLGKPDLGKPDLGKPDERVPVVVVLHGGFGTPENALTQGGWVEAAAREHFVVVAPEGLHRSWNAGGCCGPAMRAGTDDVEVVLATLDDVDATIAVDPDRVYATGISNGGMLAYRLGCDAADRFAAIAPVAATVVTEGCTPSQPISLLHIHGLADRNVPFDGGLPTRAFQPNPPVYPPARDGIGAFLRADGCDSKPQVHTKGVVSHERWRGCDDKAAVELVTIADAGHSWPGGKRLAKALDPPSTALDATSLITAFFAAHTRRP